MKKKLFSAMGLMSGTSMDGVDVSIIKSDGFDEVELILDKYFEYDTDLYKQLSTLRNKIKNSEDIFGRGNKLTKIEIDDTYPDYIYQNKEKFLNWII